MGADVVIGAMTDSSPLVMVVDDDEDIRETLAELLQDEGYRVMAVANGREALERLRENHDKPRVILLDLMMPVMDGWQFHREQQVDPTLASIPVVVITAAGAQQASSIPVDQVLAKPLGIDDVLRV